jgi:hypothetical protein
MKSSVWPAWPLKLTVMDCPGCTLVLLTEMEPGPEGGGWRELVMTGLVARTA